ncbi:MAG: SDR family oxidoreductase [Mucilaginibacter polytrichastri]|nr:SDR family oxidoreductase [Mucilaginibacter polytrichastri]
MNILITGASSGVGFEAVLELTRDSRNQVIALARSQDKLARLRQIALGLNPDAVLYPVAFDIVQDEYEALTAFIGERMEGKIDILINNAGALVNKPFAELGETDFADMLQSNFLGHVRMIQAMLPLMPKGGHIVNIGSMGGFGGSSKFPGLAAYSASKAALHTLTECLAEELKEQDIRVNCLALGSAQTEMLEQAFPGYQSPVMAFEMGQHIAHFALTGAKFYNGKVLPVAVTVP